MSVGTIGQYQLIEKIGQGGMAAVYRAYQPSLNRHVAIKIISSELQLSTEMRKRFTREAKVVSQFDHPHIMPVYDYDADHDPPYIVMRYLEGATLSDVMLKTGVPFGETAYMLNQIAAALDYSHAHGVVHRDIKPSNIMLDTDGNAYLMDFGIARNDRDANNTKLTAIGTAIGTPAYMSPEQVYGMELDYRTDIYSLGVVLFQLITGTVPFDRPATANILFAHVNEAPPVPSSVNPYVPPELDRVVLTALAKDPNQRYQSMRDLASAFMYAVGQNFAPVPYTLQSTTRTLFEAARAQQAQQPRSTPPPPPESPRAGSSSRPSPYASPPDAASQAPRAGSSSRPSPYASPPDAASQAPAPREAERAPRRGSLRPSPYAGDGEKRVVPRRSRTGNPLLWVALVILVGALGVLGYMGTGGSLDALTAFLPSGDGASGVQSTLVPTFTPRAVEIVESQPNAPTAVPTRTPNPLDRDDISATRVAAAVEEAREGVNSTANLDTISATRVAEAIMNAQATLIADGKVVAIVDVNTAYLRVSPSTTASISDTLTRGDSVRVDGRYNDWYRVEDSAGRTRWIASVSVAISINNRSQIPTVQP